MYVINIAGEPILYLKVTNVDFQPMKFAQYRRTKEFYPVVYEYSSRLVFLRLFYSNVLSEFQIL